MDQPETSITIIIIFVIISGQKRSSSSSSKSASLSASTSVQPQNSIATLLEPLQSHNALRPEPHSASAPCAVLLAGAPVKQEHVHREQGANSPMSAIALLCFSTAIACLSCSWALLAKFGVLQQWRGSSTSSSSDMTAHACPFQYHNININNINIISIISTSILSACLEFRSTFNL